MGKHLFYEEFYQFTDKNDRSKEKGFHSRTTFSVTTEEMRARGRNQPSSTTWNPMDSDVKRFSQKLTKKRSRAKAAMGAFVEDSGELDELDVFYGIKECWMVVWEA